MRRYLLPIISLFLIVSCSEDDVISEPSVREELLGIYVGRYQIKFLLSENEVLASYDIGDRSFIDNFSCKITAIDSSENQIKIQEFGYPAWVYYGEITEQTQERIYFKIPYQKIIAGRRQEEIIGLNTYQNSESYDGYYQRVDSTFDYVVRGTTIYETPFSDETVWWEAELNTTRKSEE